MKNIPFDIEFAISKKKSIPFGVKVNKIDFKEIDEESRVIKLVANTLNYFDYDGDVLVSGCANRSFANNGAKSEAPDKIAHLLHHDMHRPVGKSLLESEETVDGKKVIYCETLIAKTTDGEDTLINYKTGIYNQHSIGFRYLDIDFIEKGAAEWDKVLSTLINPEEADAAGYLWKVKEIRLWEYSTVVFGANKLTPYLGTKSQNKADIFDVVSKKIAVLANKVMTREVINKKALEFEVSQLQQMVLELSEIEPSKKDTQRTGSSVKDTQEPQKIQLIGFSKNLKF